MNVLTCLAEQAGEVVTKEDLVERVWGGFVGDEVLTNAIWELRKALHDNAKKPRFIQTVRGTGYKLLTAVVVQPKPTPPSSRRALPIRIALVVGVLTIAFVSWRQWRCVRTLPIHLEAASAVDANIRNRVRSLLALFDDVFALQAAGQPDPGWGLRVELRPLQPGVVNVNVSRGGKQVLEPIELRAGDDTGLRGLKQLAAGIRKQAAACRCLNNKERIAYLNSGAMRIDVWRTVRQAEALRRERQRIEARQRLDDAANLDPNDYYMLERYVHLHQIESQTDAMNAKLDLARQAARQRGVGKPDELDRRVFEWRGVPSGSKKILAKKAATDGTQSRMWKMRYAWHFLTYDRNCSAAINWYSEIEQDLKIHGAGPSPDLYRRRAFAALACADQRLVEADMEAYRGSQRWWKRRPLLYETLAELSILNGHYATAENHATTLRWHREFESSAELLQAELYRLRLRCRDGEQIFKRYANATRDREKRRVYDGLSQLSYECGKPVPDRVVEGLRAKNENGAYTYAPRARAFLALESILAGSFGEHAADSTERWSAHFAEPIACSPHDERPNRREEEWFCLTDAAVATHAGQHRVAATIHGHIEQRLCPDDKALFRFHAGQAYEQAGDDGEAERRYCAALDWNPSHIQSLASLGALLVARGDYGGAHHLYARAARVAVGGDPTVSLVQTIHEAVTRPEIQAAKPEDPCVDDRRERASVSCDRL